MEYKGHLVTKGTTTRSSCAMCNEDLELIDEFVNVAGMPQTQAEYQGLFSVCSHCFTPHLELLSGEVEFKGPVLIGWE